MKTIMRYLTLLTLTLLLGNVCKARDWKEKLAEKNTPTVVKLDMYGVYTLSFFGIEIGTFPVRTLCAGVNINPQGLILTAAHCVNGGNGYVISSFTATSFYGEQLLAERIAVSVNDDLAVIRTVGLPSTTWESADISSRKNLIVGEDVMVIGHPLMLYYTITTGIVSYIKRELGFLRFYTQFDAVIAPGNSGGPVFDRKGYIIGIASCYRGGPMGSLTGLNFMCDLTAIQFIVGQARDIINGQSPQQKRVRKYRIGDVK